MSDTLTVMTNYGKARRRQGARMNGDGFGSPPWGPADPVPELDAVKDTQALPGLGPVPGAAEPADGGGEGAKQDTPPDEASGEASGEGDGDGKRHHSFWLELLVLFVLALILALFIKAFAFQAFYIPSGSMQNTLGINDRVLINKIVYHLRPIHPGDIVVFDGTGSWNPGASAGSSNIFAKGLDELEGLVGINNDPNIYIKRVIGVPGDHVACCDAHGDVTVNGVALHESSYLYPGNVPSADKFNITVPPGRLWVMGDHRKISDDSRLHMGDPGGGTIPESGVLGRAFVIIWPPSRWHILDIPATFQQPGINASNPPAGNAVSATASTAVLDAALASGAPLQQTATPIPLLLGFAGAVPLTWLERKARLRRKGRLRPKGRRR